MKKNILYLIAASLCLMSLAGCDKFLETQSLVKKIDNENFPVNEKDANQMVTGIYAMMNMNLADPEEDPFFVFDIASPFKWGRAEVYYQGKPRQVDREGRCVKNCKGIKSWKVTNE